MTNKIHLVIEAHLQIDETILNPTRVGPSIAKKITELLEETYGPKPGKKHNRQVHTLIVSHRTADMAERLDTQE